VVQDIEELGPEAQFHALGYPEDSLQAQIGLLRFRSPGREWPKHGCGKPGLLAENAKKLTVRTLDVIKDYPHSMYTWRSFNCPMGVETCDP
jgi:hypothetical protein